MKTNAFYRVMLATAVTVLTALLSLPLAHAAPGDIDASFNPYANDYVYALAVQPDGKLLVGGAFTNLAGQTRNHIARLHSDGQLDLGFNPNANGYNGYVRCLALQDDGGILVGGSFSSLGGQPRSGIARLNPDGSIDTNFNPQANGNIESLLLQPDGKILLAGGFTTIAGQPRKYLARLNADGSIDPIFHPDPSNMAVSLALQEDGCILVGGTFTIICKQARSRIARLNSDGSLDANFFPSVDRWVTSIAVQSDGKILIAGLLSSVGSQTRNCIARLHHDGRLDLGFNPDFNNWVYSLVLQADGNILTGGAFTTAGGKTCNYFARLHTDGSLDSFISPNANSYVTSLTLEARGMIVMGGTFTTVNELARNRLARLTNDAAPSNLLIPSTNQIRWLRYGSAPEAQFVRFALSTDEGYTWSPLGTGTRMANGWELTGLNLPARGRIRARAWICSGDNSGSMGVVETTTAFPASAIAVEQPKGSPVGNGGIRHFTPVVPGYASDLTFAVQNLGSVELTNLSLTIDGPDAARFSIATNIAIPNLSPFSSTPLTLRFAASNLGTFQACLHIVSSDPTTSPFDIALIGTTAYPGIALEQPLGTALPQGGSTDFGLVNLTSPASLTFTVKNTNLADLAITGINIDGPNASRFSLAAPPAPTVSGPAGSTTFTVRFAPTNPGPATAMLHLLSNDPQANSLAISLVGTGRIPMAGDVDTGFLPEANANTYSIVVQPDGKWLVGGAFTNLAGQICHRLSRFTPDGYWDSSFHPEVNGTVFSLAIQEDGKILVGGNYTAIDGQTRNHLARLNADGSLDGDFNPDANDLLNTIAIRKDGKIIAGGKFTAIGGQSCQYLAQINPDGSVDTNFVSDVDSEINALAIQEDGKVLIGGYFSQIQGQPYAFFARLKVDGSLDADFNPRANNVIYCLAIQADGKILAGGNFTMLGEQTCNYLAQLNPDGSLSPHFNPDVNHIVFSLASQADGKILAGGWFTAAGGQPHHRITRLNADGNVDPSFNPSANSDVYCLAVKADGKILAGGGFTTLNEQPRLRLGGIENDPATQALTVPSCHRVEWLRGGTAPEVQTVCFELSTDGGTNWSYLGAGTRIAGGWELSGVNVPGGLVRARARVASGQYNGSSGLVEAVAAAPVVPALGLPALAPNQFHFALPTVAGKDYQVQFAPALGNESLWDTVRTIHGDGTVVDVSFTPAHPAGFYRIVHVP